jgi:hypothetical protein
METVNLDLADHQQVFDVYLGLSAAGYDLANPHRKQGFDDLIASTDWSQPILEYFHYARISDGRINPFWPRAFILTLAGLFASETPAELSTAQIRKQLMELGNLSPAEIDDEVVDWAAAFPDLANHLRKTRIYPGARALYQGAIQDEIRKHGLRYQWEVLAGQNRLRKMLPCAAWQPLISILNPLQADPLTDVISLNGRIFVVTSHLRSESYLHEQIHVALEPYLSAWEGRLVEDVGLLESVYDHMHCLTYAWDHSAASWNNVFSEMLTRVLTIWALEDGNPMQQAKKLENLVKQGFAYALPIAESIHKLPVGQPISDAWLEQCLRLCGEAVNHRL